MPSSSPLRNIARVLAASLALLLAAGASAQDRRATFSDLAYPVESYELVGDQRFMCFRAIDVMTGKPIATAELFLIAESDHPMRGEFSFEQRLVPDADGFFRVPLPVDESQKRPFSWLLLRAPGFGQHMRMDGLDEVVPLVPAVDVPVQVLDPFDRPVSDCLVGFCCGCGHTPDIAFARTNAQGLCTIAGIQNVEDICDFYLEHPQLDLFYQERDWFPGEPPARIHAKFAPAVRGLVVDHEGKPVVGAYVGYMDVHRGPWTRTDRSGQFVLCGVEDQATELWVHVGERRLLIALGADAPFRLQLPPPPAEVTQDVEVVDLPKGTQKRSDVAAPRSPLPDPSWPAVPVRLVGTYDPDQSVTVELVTDSARVEITDLVARGELVPLPAEPFAFLLTCDRTQRTLATTREQAIAMGVVRLRGFRPTRIEGRVVDEEGQPLRATLVLLDATAGMAPDFDDVEGVVETAGAIQLECEREGIAFLAVQSTDYEHVTRIVPVLLPRRGDEAFVDVGTITLRSKPHYCIRDADGDAIGDHKIALLRRGFVMTQNFGTEWGVHTDLRRDGHSPLPDLQEGDVLHVKPMEVQPVVVDGKSVYTVPARFAVHGKGPWDFTLPNGRVTLDVRCAEASAKRVHLYLDDLDIGLDGPLELRGLVPGVHRCVFAAEGHKAAIVDVEVKAEGASAIDLQLPQR